MLRPLVGVLVVAGLLAASCTGDRETDDHATNDDQRPTLVIRALDPRAEGISDGLFALDPLRPGQAGSGRPAHIDLEKFGAGDALIPFAYTGDSLVYRCDGRVCASNLSKGSSRAIGKAQCIVPSAEPGRFWLAERKRRKVSGFRAVAFAREVDVSGAMTTATVEVAQRRLACPVGSFAGGLLFQDRREKHGRSMLAIDTTGDVHRIPGLFPVGSRGSLVVTSAEAPSPHLHLTDLTNGDEDRLRAPRGWRFVPSYDGDVSPDGSRVAALISPRRGRGRGCAGTSVSISEIEEREGRVVGPGCGSLAFSADGQTLFAVGGPRRDRPRGYPTEIIAYPIDGDTPYVTATKLDILHMQAASP